MTTSDQNPGEERDLVITRLIRAPRLSVWRAWTDPELLVQWWCPKPWTTTLHQFDLRPGGGFHTLMEGPDGGSSDNPGCFLEILEQERIVWTTSLVADWRPATPWMPLTAEIVLSDEDGGTRYVATAKHPDLETAVRHKDLGFFDGWGTVTTQLDELAQSLT